jgi:phage minor structural protein
MVVAKIFKETDTVFESIGEHTIKPLLCKVHEEDNSDFFLELEVKNEEVWKMERKGIVAVKYNDKWQGFRFGRREIVGKKTYFKCWHVSYDMQDYLIRDLLVDGVAFNTAVQTIRANTTRENPFTFYTMKTTSVEVEIHNNSLYDVAFALLGAYNCKILRDNYKITFINSRGSDNQETIEYGKNLTLLEEYSDVEDLVTELYPSLEFNGSEYPLEGECISDLTIYNRVYTKHKKFTPLNEEYLQSIVDEINEINTEIDRYNTLINQTEADIQNANNELIETEDEIAAKTKEVQIYEEEYMRKLENSLDTREKIYTSCVNAIKDQLSVINKKINSTNSKLTKKNTSLKTYEGKKEEYREKYSQYTKKGYKEKAKEAKEKITEYTAKISTLKTEIRTLKTTLNSQTKVKEKLLKYEEDFSSVEEVTKYDISKLLTLLKDQGLGVIGDIVTEYEEANSEIAEYEKTIETIKNKYDEIYKLHAQVDSLKNEVQTYQLNSEDFIKMMEKLGQVCETKKEQLYLEIQDDLRKQANMYLNKYKYPQVCYSVESLPFEVEIGDTIEVKHSKLGIDLETEVIVVEYDCILSRNTMIQFGNTTSSIAKMNEALQNATNDAIARNQLLMENAYSNMMSAVAGIEGYVAGLTKTEIRDDNLVTYESQLSINQNKISAKVSKSAVDSLVQAKVDIAAEQIASEVVKLAKEEVVKEISGTYVLMIVPSDGLVVDDTHTSTTLTAVLLQNNVDISSTVDASWFQWKRKSTDARSDMEWNRTEHKGTSITIRNTDFDTQGTFICTVTVPREGYWCDNNGNRICDSNGNRLVVSVPETVISCSVVVSESFVGYKTLIKQTAEDILLKTSRDDVNALIKIWYDNITIAAEKINLNGLVTANNFFKILEDGSFETIKGVLANWIVKGNTIASKDGSTVLNAEDGSIVIKETDTKYIRVRKGVFTSVAGKDVTQIDEFGYTGLFYDGNDYYRTTLVKGTKSVNGSLKKTPMFNMVKYKYNGPNSYEQSTIANVDAYNASFLPAYSNTTTTSSNIVVDSSGALKRSTSSSKRYKERIEDVSYECIKPEKLLDLPVYQYYYKEGYITDPNCYSGIQIGFLVEDVDEIYPIAVERDKEGNPEMWNEKYIIPGMLELIKKQQKQIEELNKKYEDLVSMKKE